MAVPDRINLPYTKESEQSVLNKSQDPKFGVIAVEALVYNPATDSLDRMTQIGTVTERFASAGGYDYVGEAVVGSSESSAVWNITRYNATSGKVAVNGIWANYLTETYL